MLKNNVKEEKLKEIRLLGSGYIIIGKDTSGNEFIMGSSPSSLTMYPSDTPLSVLKNIRTSLRFKYPAANIQIRRAGIAVLKEDDVVNLDNTVESNNAKKENENEKKSN